MLLDELTDGCGLDTYIPLDVAEDTTRDTVAWVAAANRELHADFHLADFDHVVRFDESQRWIEMHLRARRRLTVTVADLGLTVALAAGETIRTEISAKFEPDQLDHELSAAGLRTEARWTDPAGDYSLTLAVR